MVPWVHPSPHPKRHLGGSAIFAGLTTVTDRQTTLLGFVTTGRICVSSTGMRPKTAEPIEMPFGIWTGVGSRKVVLVGVHTGAI